MYIIVLSNEYVPCFNRLCINLNLREFFLFCKLSNTLSVSIRDIMNLTAYIFNFIMQEFSGFFKPEMNCTFNGLVSIFFLCGWSDAITFQMLSDKCYIICRFIICNIERWGKNFNSLVFFLSFLSTVS